MAELSALAQDPTQIVTFAVGDPFPKLKAQNPNDGINFGGVFFDHPKRYVLKKARFSLSDHRIFDYDTGRLVVVSHHPGKNPFGGVDPLDVAGTGDVFSFMGEWESLCDVTAYENGFQSFKVRPQTLSRHGRQRIKSVDDTPIMTVSKIGRLKSLSMRKQFCVGKGEEHDAVYKCSADAINRTIQVMNKKGQLIAQLTKSSKNIIMTAALGVGQETIIDVAPGVDCSAIMCVVIGLKQVGVHYASDAFNNFVKDPLVGNGVDKVKDQVNGGEEGGDAGGGGEIPETEIPEIGEVPDLSGIGEEDPSDALEAIGGFLEMFFG